MRYIRTPIRYAHTDGKTDCCYTDSGIITCGTDGDLRIWTGIDDDDPTSKCVGEFVLSVVFYDNRILVATDLNTVQAYTYPEFEKDGTEFRFTAPANCIQINKNYIVAGSEDTEIKCRLRDKSEDEFELLGHKGPVIYIDINKNDLLASYGGDGKIRIWDLKAKKEIKSFDVAPKLKTLDGTKSYEILSFEPVIGNFLAYIENKKINVLNTSTWKIQYVLISDEIQQILSCLKFSMDGLFIACGTLNGNIYVWDCAKQQTLSGDISNKDSQGITAIKWNPDNNGEFAYCDSSGQLGTIINCFDNLNHNDDDNEDFLNCDEVDNVTENDFDGINFEEDPADMNNDNCISLEKLKNETLNRNPILSDFGDDNHSDNKNVNSLNDPKDTYIHRFTQQSPFQPGSSPMNLNDRYLTWNNVGIVRANNQNTDNGSIDVEFHDAAIHHNLYMKNYSNHTMASLSKTVLALSSENSNKLICISLALSGSHKEWSADLPNCEGVVAIAVTDRLVAACTDNRVLRIFTALGTQREVISIPGPIVAVCGRDNKLMVVFHSAPASADQHMSAILLQTFGFTLRTKETKLPITPGKKLTWIGYSDKGSPVCCDTMGLIQMFSMKTNCWYPVCDTMKLSQSVSNNYFIVEISESTQQVQAILCRGSSYPLTSPKPLVQELPMQIQICEMDSEKSQLEESLIRWMNFNVDNSERLIKESAVKLFSIACRSEMEARAKELIETLASPTILSIAVKYASRIGRIHLADKLTELLPQLEEQEKQHEKELQEIEITSMNLLQSGPLPCTLLGIPSSSSQTKKTPVIAPKAIRNPFKRTSVTNSGSKSSTLKENPLSHLTEKAIGFEPKKPDNFSQDLFEMSGVSSLNTSNSVQTVEINNEIKANNSNSKTKETFGDWCNSNKERLEATNSNASETELTRVAFNEYKSIKNTASSNKRKYEEDVTEKKQSGISKLAKFSFFKSS